MALGCQTTAFVPFEVAADVDGKVVLPLEFFGDIRLLVMDYVRAAKLFEVEVLAICEDVFAVKGIGCVGKEGCEGEN